MRRIQHLILIFHKFLLFLIIYDSTAINRNLYSQKNHNNTPKSLPNPKKPTANPISPQPLAQQQNISQQSLSQQRNNKMFSYEQINRHQTPQNRTNVKASNLMLSQNIENRIGTTSNLGISHRMKLAVISRKPQTITVSSNWKNVTGTHIKNTPLQNQYQKQDDTEEVLLGQYLTTLNDKISHKQPHNENSARYKIFNNQTKQRLLRYRHRSSQKQTSTHEYQPNNQLEQLNSRYNNTTTKKPLKMSINLLPSQTKGFTSVSINQLDKLSHSGQKQEEGTRKEDGMLVKISTASHFVVKDKYQPYFKRKKPIISKNSSFDCEEAPHTISAFDRVGDNASAQTDKQRQKNQSPSIPEVKNRIHLLLDNDLYFAESFKGRRPYNQDTYICETKSMPNIRQRFQHISNRPHQGTQNIRQLKQNSIEENREPNNNYWLFGVFDGHGGSKCSEYLKQNFNSFLSLNKNLFIDSEQALRQTFTKLQQKFLSLCEKSGSLDTSGSCAVVCFINSSKIYIGNVGDSRALLLGPSSIKQITKDHKPDDKQQKMRIIRYGGKLYKDGSVMGATGKENIRVFNQTRIMPGSLNVSRTFGDIEVKMKKYGGSPGIVVADPEIFVQNFDDQHDHILLASDGLFEGLTNQQIHDNYKQLLAQFCAGKKETQATFAKSFVKQIIRKSGEKSSDNITVIFVKLPKRRDQF